jgi:hypothetical protein
MSVGLQRLREEPDAIRQGAIDKGEDPGLVDTALANHSRCGHDGVRRRQRCLRHQDQSHS